MNYNLSPEMHDVLLQAVKFAIKKKQNFSAGHDYQVTLGDALAMLEEPLRCPVCKSPWSRINN